MKKNSPKGFTLIELALVVGIIAIIGLVSLLMLSSRKGTADLDGTTKQIAALLREAQSRSVSQVQGSGWGVHFDNNSPAFFSLFKGSVYATSSEITHIKLSNQLAYSTVYLPLNMSKDIIFSQISGSTAGGTIAINLLRSQNTSTALQIASSGAVSF